MQKSLKIKSTPKRGIFWRIQIVIAVCHWFWLFLIWSLCAILFLHILEKFSFVENRCNIRWNVNQIPIPMENHLHTITIEVHKKAVK